MHDRAVGTGARNGFKADVLQAVIATAELFKLSDDLGLCYGAGGLGIHPTQHLHHGCTVAQMRLGCAFDLGCVFAALWAGHKVRRPKSRDRPVCRPKSAVQWMHRGALGRPVLPERPETGLIV